MDEKLLAKAESLAKRDYTITIQRDHTTGGEVIYFAQCEELEGCMAQGESIDEAIQNIKVAIEDFIYFLLEDNMPVPAPSQFHTMGVEGSISKEINVCEEDSGFVTRRNKRIERLVVKEDQWELTSTFVKAYET